MSGEHRESPGPAREAALIGRRYRLDGVIGRGGFGVVHRATDELLQRQVAVKEVRLPTDGSEKERELARERVLREARAAGRLHHPGAVSVLDVISEGDLPWIVMELVDGQSLSKIIDDRGKLPVTEVGRIGISLAYALEAAHRLGIVHRDVKPSNVLVTADGRARLTDFGIAVSHGDPRLTSTGMVLGSPAYLSPERARGDAGTAASDRWGLGATLFTAVEGTSPFPGTDPLSILAAVVQGRRRPFRSAGQLAPVIDDLMALREAARPNLAVVRSRLRDIVDSDRRTHRPRPSRPPIGGSSPPGGRPSAAPHGPGQADTRLTTPAGDATRRSGSDATAVLDADRSAARLETTTKATAPADTKPTELITAAATGTSAPRAGDISAADAADATHVMGASGVTYPNVTDPDATAMPDVTGERLGPSDSAGAPDAGTDRADTPCAADAIPPTDAAPAPARDPAEPSAPALSSDPGPSPDRARPSEPVSSAAPMPATPETADIPPTLETRRISARLPGGHGSHLRLPGNLDRIRSMDRTRAMELLRPADRMRALGGIPARARLAVRGTPGSGGTSEHPDRSGPTGTEDRVHGERRSSLGGAAAAGTSPAPPGPRNEPGSPNAPGWLFQRADGPARPESRTRPATPGGAPGPEVRVDGSPSDGTARHAASRWSRRSLLILVAAVTVAVVVAVVAIVALAGSGGDTDPPGAAGSDASTEVTAAGESVSTDSRPLAPPPGWVSYIDEAGWSIAYPSTWQRRPGPGGPGNVDFIDPAAGTFLRIGSVESANTSAIEDWLANEVDFREQAQDYRRIRISPGDGADGATQADWEFTYSSGGGTVHVLNRGAVRNGHGYALYWHTRQELWESDQPLRRQLYAAFRPAP